MDNPYYEKLVNASLRYVSYRPRSEKELTDFLTKKLVLWKVSGGVLIEKVVERMRELGYVDDRAFARWWVDQRSTFKPKGARLISLDLARKGISKETLEEALQGNAVGQGAFDELKIAQKAILKKVATWAQLPTIEQKRKMYTFLAQRGFSYDVIEKIIADVVKKE